MPTIAAGSSPTIALTAGQQLYFPAGGAGIATIWRAGAAVQTGYRSLGASPITIGPYSTDHVVSISCERQLTYQTLASNPSTSPPLQAVLQDPSTGQQYAGGSPASRKRKGLWQGASNFQFFTAGATQNYTWRMQVELAAPALWFRLGFAKSPNSAWSVDKLYVGPSTVFGSPDTSGSWVQATFAGGTATSLTVPQWTTVPTGYAGSTPGDFVWSDRCYCPTVARTDGGTDHLALFSLFSSSSDTPSINNASDVGFASLALGKRWKKFFMSGGDRANSTAAFTATAQGTAPFFAIEYGTTTKCISMGVFGDSITYGLKSALQGKGWILQTRATLLAALPGAGIECVMSGVSGDKPPQYLNRLKLMAATGVLPDIVFFCPYSRNLFTNAATAIAIADDAIQTIRAAGSTPVLVMAIAETAIPGNNANASAVNALIPALAASWGIPYVDMTTVTPSLDADGIHPDDPMNTAMGNTAAAAVSAVVQSMLVA